MLQQNQQAVTQDSTDTVERKASIYTVNHKKGGSAFVIITLENLDGF